jgi:replication fork clamp-binding protein CrfC
MALFKKKEAEKKDNDEAKQLLVQSIIKRYKNAYDSKASKHELWDKCYKAYTGELFKKDLPEYTSQEVSNFVFSTVESIKPIMLADNPKFIVMPQKQEFMNKAQIVQSIMDYEWQRAKMFSHLVRSCAMGLIFGTVPMAVI